MRLNFLLRGQNVQGSMWSDIVINTFPCLQDLIKCGQIPILVFIILLKWGKITSLTEKNSGVFGNHYWHIIWTYG